MMLVSFLVLFGLTVLVNKHEASSAVNETTSAEAPLDESLWESSVEFYKKVSHPKHKTKIIQGKNLDNFVLKRVFPMFSDNKI